ncbi:hypothetical protein [Aequorivita sp. CIP111184]|uniref:hypothetical protein n=1 Tax=Aequorivita sp. CIP111184 TaxID=2211356 RepID=UPI000DBC2B30|nr:hypothetical protein [Aequorivita sp. CIP111184]SRX54627.1 hypothetical protein AEQU1_01638 [Aequorivita sp. CIP111184]
MKRDLRKQNLKLKIQLNKGLNIPSLISDSCYVKDIDDQHYLISLDLSRGKSINAQDYETLNNSFDALEQIEIEDDNAIKNFKKYYIHRYGNNQGVSLKNVSVNLIMDYTRSITCNIEVEKVLKLSKVS